MIQSSIRDCLTHVTPDGQWFTTPHDASVERLLREMDTNGVRQSVVVALAGHIENAFVAEVCARYPDRLVPGASLNPAEYAGPDEARAAARKALKDSPFRVLKLHPRLGQYDPLDPRCLAVLEEIESWPQPLPVWICTLMRSRGGTLAKPPVDTCHDLVGRFPKLTFVLCHSAGSDVLRLADAVRDCPNAFLDVSFTLARYQGSSVDQDLTYLFRTFDRRMLFGSDFPEMPVAQGLETFRALARGIPLEKCFGILGGNLGRILGEEGL